jgi:hypothetical protein
MQYVFSRAKQTSLVLGAALSFCPFVIAQQGAATDSKVEEPLKIEAGTPLRLYLTERVSYGAHDNFQAKFAEAVWAFDRIVIPAGTVAEGHISELKPVPRMVRASAMAVGNFTPLKRAEAAFTLIVLPDGRQMHIATRESLALPTIFVPPRPGKSQKPAKPPPSGKVGAARGFIEQQARTQLRTQLNGRTGGLFDMIRGPNKREWLEEFLLNKLPWRPQWYRRGTRFDAVLEKPLDFGQVQIPRQELQRIATEPPADSVAEMRILSTVSSADAHVGDRLDGVLAAPLFTADHKLVLPEGTRVTGKITLARRARSLHRGGKLRFLIDDLQVPEMNALAAPSPVVEPVRAQLIAVEADPGNTKVDGEGTAKATESKTRLLRPVIAGLVAAKSLDNDAGKQTASGSGSPNTAGLALGGFSGFGLFGIALSRGPAAIGSALGFYGLGWSVYSNVISRGHEVVFQQNTAMAIRFGTPPRKK